MTERLKFVPISFDQPTGCLIRDLVQGIVPTIFLLLQWYLYVVYC